MELWQNAAVSWRVCQLRVGRGPERHCPAAQGRRRGVRLGGRTVGPRPGDRVRRFRCPRGGRRSGERGGQQRGSRLAGPGSGARRAQRQAERERRPSAAGQGRDRRSGTSDHGD